MLVIIFIRVYYFKHFGSKADKLFKQFKGKTERVFKQLVLLQQQRAKVLLLCHVNSWAGRLGINKTKERIGAEFYSPERLKT
jgi:hypothetical protein